MHWTTTQHTQHMRYIDYDMAALVPMHGRKYNWYLTNAGPHPGTHFASVMVMSRTCANMHSSSQFPAVRVLPTTFLGITACGIT
jgi:hypothetical protein